MKRLGNLMIRRWKEKDRWRERRSSEPYRVGEYEEEEEEKRERHTGRRERQTGRWMLRRKSEPCAQMEEEEKVEERKSETGWKKERRRSELNMEGDGKEIKRMAEMEREKERRKSASWTMVDGTGRQMDRKHKETDRRTLRRRSEPCGTMYVQLLPMSNRKRKDLLQRQTGLRTSCREEGDREQTDGYREMARGTSEPISSPGNSKHKKYRGSLL